MEIYSVTNYFYSNWRGTYKGKGDKKEKYPYVLHPKSWT